MTSLTDKMSAGNSRAAYMREYKKASGQKKIIVVMYPNEHSYMPQDSVNIEKHTTTYLLNTCVFNVNPKNQDSQIMPFFTAMNLCILERQEISCMV
jgi:hypothetical protein